MNRVLKKSVFLSLAAILSLGAYGQASTQSYSVADPYTAETFAQIFKVETKIATNGNISFDMTLGDGGQETLHLGGLDLADPVFTANLQLLRGAAANSATNCGGVLKDSGDNAGLGNSLYYLSTGQNGPVQNTPISNSGNFCEMYQTSGGGQSVVIMAVPTGRLVTITNYVGPDAQVRMESYDSRAQCMGAGGALVGRYGQSTTFSSDCPGIYAADGSLIPLDANNAQSVALDMDSGNGSVSFIVLNSYEFVIEDESGTEQTAFDPASSSAHTSRNEEDAGFRYIPSALNLFYN